jgi:trimethylguanosine synthase
MYKDTTVKGPMNREEERMQGKVLKFVKQKYFFFSRYDAGIKIDEEGWFSATAEPIAKYTAQFLKSIPKAKVVDCCCSIGGNLIQFALLPNVSKCIGVDLNETRIKYARHNCETVYGIKRDKMIYVNTSISECNVMAVLWMEKDHTFRKRNESLVYFFDPPWGGMDYQQKEYMTLFEDYAPYPMREMLIKAFSHTDNVMLKLPKNTDLKILIKELAQCYREAMLSPDSNPEESSELLSFSLPV